MNKRYQITDNRCQIKNVESKSPKKFLLDSRCIILRIFLITVVSYLLSVICLDAAFKDIGWSARSAGMGGAFTAVSDDSSGILYNPAGLTQAESPEVNLMYAKLFAGLDEVDLGLNYGAFLFPTKGMGTFALNWANFTSANQYREDTVSLAYARSLNVLVKHYLKRRLAPEISFGVNVKYLSHSYTLDKYAREDPVFDGGDSKAGVAVDCGIWSRPMPNMCPGLTTGLVFKNINEPDVGLKTEDIVPMEIRYGLAYKINKCRSVRNILTSIDVAYRNQEWGSDKDKLNLYFGMEAWAFNEILGFRLGGNYNELATGFSVMMPEKFNLNLKLDYAFLWPMKIKETLGTHRVSLTYRF